jgi:hypothetical protein
MGITGQHPETGVRVDVQRPREGGPPWRYEGEAATARERYPMSATVAADGTVEVTIRPDSQAQGQGHGHGHGNAGASHSGLAELAELAELGEKVRLILRSAWKHGQDDGAAPPRRIVRWRPQA